MPKTALATAIAGIAEEDARVKVLKAVHPLVATFGGTWALLSDAYEGDGGFLDGRYLWRFPAEIADDYDRRREHARYHNFVETLVDIYVRHVCGRGITRSTKNADLQQWWTNVDGAGTTIAAFMKQVAARGLVQGHVGVLVDKTPEPPVGPAKADERATVIATLFSAEDILDWRLERNALVAVKLREAAPDPAITDDPSAIGTEDHAQYALWDRTEWARFTSDATLVNEDAHDLGLVPLAVLRPKPSTKHTFIGRPLVKADVVRALYNRASEEDHVMRAQGFSLLTVQVPAEASADAVTDAQAAVEKNYGVTRALVVQGAVSYQSPEMAIPETLRGAADFLIREMYRAAHITWQRDSADAESAESIRLKHTELNEMLRALAQALGDFERQLARFWCGWMSATPAAADALYAQAEVVVAYPDDFFTAALIDDLTAWAQAVRFGLPEVFVKRMLKRLVRRIEPDIPDVDAKAIDEAIEARPDRPAEEPAPADEIRARAAARLKRAMDDEAAA